MRDRWLSAVFAIAILAVVPWSLQAQQSTGDIYGQLVDETGGALPGVAVTLTGSLIGTQNQTSGINGDFHFIRLSPGEYDVQCELDGFTTVRREQVKVVTAGAVNLQITMKPAPVDEIITVIAEQPILDTKKTGVGQNITNDVLANIPTARDPWVVLSMVSGIVVDRVNIAGAEGGQQSEFTSRGDVGGDNAMWNMDGVTITDMAAVGSSPTYYDFDAFEEIQVTTGGNDPSQATGGMGINFVSKRGGDIPKGSARFIVTSKGLQGDNTKDLQSNANPGGSDKLDGFIWNPGFKRPVLIKSRDYGVEVGGPFKKETAWYWGAVGVQDIQSQAVTGAADNTQLENISFKANAQAGEDTTLTYMYYRGDKIKRGRNAGATRPPETTWNQSGPTNIHKIEVSRVMSPNFYVNGKLGIVKGGFALTPQGGLETSAWRDINRVWHGSQQYLSTDRPQMQISADNNYFKSGFGGNHELKFGFSYRKVETESVSLWPGTGASTRVSSAYTWARVTRPGNAHTENRYLGVYVGDTFTRNRLTLNLGVRFDRQNGSLLEATTSGSPILPDLIPAMTVAAKDAPFSWSDISPRLGLTYDVSGDGKTLVRGSFAKYADQMSGGDLAFLSPIPFASGLDYYWTDLNGDHVAQRDELDLSYGPIGTYYFDPNNPTSTETTTNVDPNLKAPQRTELIVGGEREIMANFAVGGNFVWRRAENQTWLVGTDYRNPNATYTYDDYELAGYVEGTLPDGTPYKMPYYKLRAARADLEGAGVYTLWTNRPDYYQQYTGLELFATKRLSDRWMLNASFNYQRDREYLKSNKGIANPSPGSGTDAIDGRDVAFQSGSSGKNGYWIATPKWQFNLNGLYQLPLGVTASANLISRQGYPVVYTEDVDGVDPGESTKTVQAVKIYDKKLPDMIELDFRISKTVSFAEKGNLMLDLDVFNILNKNTPLHVQETLAIPDSNQVQDLMYPRTVRFGIRYTF